MLYSDEVYNDFLYKKEINEGLSKHTIHTYKTLFNHIQADDVLNINDIPYTFTTSRIQRFLGGLCISRKWSSETYNRNRKNLKVFCDYLIENMILLDNPVKQIKDRKETVKLPKYLNQSQLQRVKKAVGEVSYNPTFHNKRNKLIFTTFLYTGLRLDELVSLKITDIDFQENTIFIRSGKGNKDRLIPLLDELKKEIIDYFYEFRKRNKTLYLFPSTNGKKLQHRDIYVFFKKIQGKVLFRLHPHMLRHTFATELVKQDINLYTISKLLGHSKLDTTKIYLNLNLQKTTYNLNEKALYSP